MLLQLYHQLSIYIVLVGVEVWEASDQINVDGSDRTQTIADFCDYRRNNINPVHNNDHAQLFTWVLIGRSFIALPATIDEKKFK